MTSDQMSALNARRAEACAEIKKLRRDITALLQSMHKGRRRIDSMQELVREIDNELRRVLCP